MPKAAPIRQAFVAAFPVMLGYAAVGLPCGILSASVGLNAVQVLLFSALYYSGAGQFMVCGMWLAGTPVASIVASISLLNTRQLLYSASMAQFCEHTGKRLSFLFAATLTDEGYGLNMRRFSAGQWSVPHAVWANLLLLVTWAAACVAGVFLGAVLSVPLALAAFAMTSIFICLLVTQALTIGNAVAAGVAVAVTVICKAGGLSEMAIFIGALAGVAAAAILSWVRRA